MLKRPALWMILAAAVVAVLIFSDPKPNPNCEKEPVGGVVALFSC